MTEKKQVKEEVKVDQNTNILKVLAKFEGISEEDIDSNEFYSFQKEIKMESVMALEDIEAYRIQKSADDVMPKFIAEVLELLKGYQYKANFDTEEVKAEKYNNNLQISQKITELHLSHNLEVGHFKDVEDTMSDIKEIVNIASRGSKQMTEAVLITMVEREFGDATVKSFTKKYKQIAEDKLKEVEAKKKDLKK